MKRPKLNEFKIRGLLVTSAEFRFAPDQEEVVFVKKWGSSLLDNRFPLVYLRNI